jgi:PhnB protein
MPGVQQGWSAWDCSGTTRTVDKAGWRLRRRNGTVSGLCNDVAMPDEKRTVVVPARYSRVDPWVISKDTDAEIAFLGAAFDARETPGSRMLGPDGRIGHVEVELGDAVIMMFDAGPEWPATPSHLRVYVADTQNAVSRAVAAGARVVTRTTELPFGERVARVRDPQGHLWWIHEHFEDVDAADLASRFADPSAQKAMIYVQESLASELSSVR